MKVIGAGVGRTGTYSLKLALERLGLGPCHHMEEVIYNPPVHVPLWSAESEVAGRERSASRRHPLPTRRRP